ncbi:lipase/esterase [Aspergillus granulosus]|uniref:Lipase/esterase n=1 Tax=Aspergillus granulosus TaxID=176169 RepID=A0ABR4HDF4_9EURO
MPSPLQAISLLVTTTPIILTNLFLHLVGFSQTSNKWNLYTAVTITALRALLSQAHKSTITIQQQRTIQDRPVCGAIWISRVTFPASLGQSVRDVVLDIIQALGNGRQEYAVPDLGPVTAEWTGYRATKVANAPEPNISEEEKYRRLMNMTTSPVTLLYFHGGAYYLMDPASHRGVVSEYARLTGGRALSLLDALLVYLSLLYPPDGTLHDPVKPEHIVLGGDSSGGNLALALLQTVRQLHKSSRENNDSGPTVFFHGRPVTIPIPAGLALISPTLDLTRSLRSPTPYDYLAPSSPTHNPVTSSPPCGIWPSDPPRADLFTTASALTHPLVSPLAATQESWKDSPPIFLSCGEEMISTECKVFASILARQGVTVVWEQYEAMPHCFSHLFLQKPVGKSGVQGVARFVKEVVAEPAAVRMTGCFIKAGSLDRKEVDVAGLGGGVEDRVLERMDKAKDEIAVEWEKNQ